MSMFDWTPQQRTNDSHSGNDPASKYLWVYWVVAIPLTAVVLIVWRLWMNREDKKYRSDLHKAREDRSKMTPGLRLSGFEQFTPTKKLMAEYSETQKEQLRPTVTQA